MANKDKSLLIVLLALMFTGSLLAAIMLTSNFTYSLLASIIGVLLTVVIAYLFLDRYRREREEKERVQRAEIQKDILGQIEEIFIMLVGEFAENLNNYLEEPVDLYGEERGDWSKFSILVEKSIFNWENWRCKPGQNYQIDLSSMEDFIDSMGNATRRIYREMQLHPGVLDEIRGVTRELNQFQEHLDRYEKTIKRERERGLSGRKSSGDWSVESLLWLCHLMIEVVRAIGVVVSELGLDKSKANHHNLLRRSHNAVIKPVR